MTDPRTTEDLERRERRRRLIALALALLSAVTILMMVIFYYWYYSKQFGPAQPIAFSHRIHAKERQISCLMCHSGVTKTSRATVPPVQRCMLCHEHIITTYPEVAKVRDHYYAKQPIEWVRVNDLPEFVYFPHQMHLNAAMDCAQCHGDISSMDRVRYMYKFEMGFCMQCHKDYGAPTDCFTCHR